jgi:hypothetical protein
LMENRDGYLPIVLACSGEDPDLTSMYFMLHIYIGYHTLNHEVRT